MIKNRLQYIGRSFGNALVVFSFTFFGVYTLIANGNIFIATVGNIAIIFLILAHEKLEYYIIKKAHDKYLKKPRGVIRTYLKKTYLSWTANASFKSGLYCFYIFLLLFIALTAAKPEFPLLYRYTGYFESVRYGLLILIASDKFMDQVFKDLREKKIESS